MIKYEIKKNIIYNRGWILIVLLLLFPFAKHIIVDNQYVDVLEADHYVYYHKHLNGKMNEDKVKFLDNEAIIMENYELQRNTLMDQYKNEEINDTQYIESLDTLNTYSYRKNVYDDIKEYTDYLNINENTSYINEHNMNRFLNFEIPYLLIAVIILITAISFQNEKDSISLINTTINGKRKLMSVKMHTLILINTIIFTLYFLSNAILNFDIKYSFELLTNIKSSRLFETSFLNNRFLTLFIMMYLIQLLAVIQLTLLNAYMMIKTKISAIKLFIIEFSIFVVSYFIYADSKLLYWISPIGFFHPLRYFVDKNLLVHGDKMELFSQSEVIFITLITITLMIVLISKSKSIIMTVLLFILTACQSEIIYDESMNYHNNDFNCNDIACVSIVEDLLLDLKTNEVFEINRNITEDFDHILTGTMFHQYYYFITQNDNKWSLQRLNTENFEQTKIYEESVRAHDIFGNIKPTPPKRSPLNIYVDENNIFIIYHHKIDVLINHNKLETLVSEYARIIKTEDDDVYLINDKNQLEVLNLTDQSRTTVMETLLIQAQIDDEYIYYDTLKDESVHRFNRKNGNTELLIDNVNFFQVADNRLYYTTVGGKGIHIYALDTQKETTILPKQEIYTILIIDDTIQYTALDPETSTISWFQFKDEAIFKVSK